MNPNDPNVVMMELVADRLGDRLRDDGMSYGDYVRRLPWLQPNTL